MHIKYNLFALSIMQFYKFPTQTEEMRMECKCMPMSYPPKLGNPPRGKTKNRTEEWCSSAAQGMPPWKGGGEMIKEVHMAPRRENLWRFHDFNGTISEPIISVSSLWALSNIVKYFKYLQVIIFELTRSAAQRRLRRSTLDPPFHQWGWWILK